MERAVGGGDLPRGRITSGIHSCEERESLNCAAILSTWWSTTSATSFEYRLTSLGIDDNCRVQLDHIRWPGC